MLLLDRALLWWHQKGIAIQLTLLRRQAFLRGGRLAPQGAQSSTGNTRQLQPASIVAVTATWCWTSKPPGTDTLKSHLPGSRGKTNLIAAFVVPKRPWVLWVNPRGTKQAHLRKSFRGHLHATDSAAQTCCPGSHHVPVRSQTPRGEPRLQNISGSAHHSPRRSSGLSPCRRMEESGLGKADS